NAPPSIKRSFAYCKLPIQAMKTFGKQHDATVNDVLLTLLDMAMTRYLDERHPEQRIRPLQPLVADMPVALGGSEQGGNRIAVLQIPLGAPKANPMRRLEDICEHSREIKDQIRHESAAAMTMHTAAIHAIPALAELLGIKHPPTLANTVISNPFGYPQRCYLGGAEVEMALPLAVLAPGQSLNITAATYDDSLQIAFMGIAKETPDIQLLADYTRAAFDELSAACGDTPSAESGATNMPSNIPPRKAKTVKVIRPPAAAKPKRTARK
ncbi:MAG TPA: WS/DGAT domain-containing protein, partial [Rhodocyclaceae bacterium]|nr:WS/DGAT domain-containing protein [Rhodocyclaceae bacterium]